MKKQIVFMLLMVILCGCQSGSRKSQTYDLPVIDISKNYPKKEIRLQDIADIEYIPLETTDDVLLGNLSNLSYVSDNFIIAWDMSQGSVFTFNRKGKIINSFNHKGQGDKEYFMISSGGVIVDEKTDELFLFADRILVYSMSGEYKRTLKYPDSLKISSKASNFDDETLLVYDEYNDWRDDNRTKPYLLLSKKDGSIVAELDINLPVRYSNTIRQTVNDDSGQSVSQRFTFAYLNSRQYGFQDFVITEITSDTIYKLNQNKDLTPMLVRTPSVHASEPRVIWSTSLTTDKFIVFEKNTLDFNAGINNRDIPSVTFIYEFASGEINEVSFLNSDFPVWGLRLGLLPPDIEKNMQALLLWPSRLKTAYEENQLHGKLRELAQTLDEEDNPVVMIVKFK